MSESRVLYAEWRPNPDEPPVWFVREIPATATMDRKASECVIAVTQEVAVPKMQEHDSRVRLPDIQWWTEKSPSWVT